LEVSGLDCHLLLYSGDDLNYDADESSRPGSSIATSTSDALLVDLSNASAVTPSKAI
jgi:hypothetical protein